MDKKKLIDICKFFFYDLSKFKVKFFDPKNKSESDILIVNTNTFDLDHFNNIYQSKYLFLYIENDELNKRKLSELENKKILIYKTEISEKIFSVFLLDESINLDIVMKPLISICIPTYCKNETINDHVLLKSISKWDKSININKELIEIIIVENGTDKFINYNFSETSDLNIKYKHISEANLSLARKITVNESTSDILLLVNDDTIPNEYLVERHLKYQYLNTHNKLALLGKFDLHKNVINTKFTKKLNQYSQNLFAQNFYQDNTIHCCFDAFYTNNLSIRKNIVIEAGNFSNDFKVAAGDDVDLGIRLGRLDYKILFKGDLISQHHHYYSSENIVNCYIQRGFWAVKLYQKYDEAKFKYIGRNNIKSNELIEETSKDYNKYLEIKKSWLNDDIESYYKYYMLYTSQFLFKLGFNEGLKHFYNIKDEIIKKTNESKVSIIINCRSKNNILINETLESIENQSYKNFEIILISKNKINSNHKNIYEKNTNSAKLKNNAIKESNGKYLFFINEGDVLLPFSLKIMLLEDNKIILYKNIIEYENYLKIDYLSNTFFDKDVFNEIGLFDESLIESENIDLTFRIKQKYFSVIDDIDIPILIKKSKFENSKEKIQSELINKSKKYIEKGDLFIAENYLNNILELNDSPIIYYLIGKIYYEKEEYSKSLDQLTKSINLGFKNYDFYLLFAKTLEKLNQSKIAAEFYKKADLMNN